MCLAAFSISSQWTYLGLSFSLSCPMVQASDLLSPCPTLLAAWYVFLKSGQSYPCPKSSVLPKELKLDPLMWLTCIHIWCSSTVSDSYPPHVLCLSCVPDTPHISGGFHASIPLCLLLPLPGMPFPAEHSNSPIKLQLRGHPLHSLSWLPLTKLIISFFVFSRSLVQTLFSTWLHYFNYFFFISSLIQLQLSHLGTPQWPHTRGEVPQMFVE